MKRFYFSGLIAIIMIGCGERTDATRVKQLLPGVYVSSWKDDNRTANDTLIISIYHEAAGIYLIIKKTGFNRIEQGIKMSRQFSQHSMQAIFNPQTMQLQESKTGRMYSFNPSKESLLLGATLYQKIK